MDFHDEKSGGVLGRVEHTPVETTPLRDFGRQQLPHRNLSVALSRLAETVIISGETGSLDADCRHRQAPRDEVPNRRTQRHGRVPSPTSPRGGTCTKGHLPQVSERSVQGCLEAIQPTTHDHRQRGTGPGTQSPTLHSGKVHESCHRPPVCCHPSTPQGLRPPPATTASPERSSRCCSQEGPSPSHGQRGNSSTVLRRTRRPRDSRQAAGREDAGEPGLEDREGGRARGRRHVEATGAWMPQLVDKGERTSHEVIRSGQVGQGERMDNDASGENTSSSPDPERAQLSCHPGLAGTGDGPSNPEGRYARSSCGNAGPDAEEAVGVQGGRGCLPSGRRPRQGRRRLPPRSLPPQPPPSDPDVHHVAGCICELCRRARRRRKPAPPGPPTFRIMGAEPALVSATLEARGFKREGRRGAGARRPRARAWRLLWSSQHLRQALSPAEDSRQGTPCAEDRRCANARRSVGRVV